MTSRTHTRGASAVALLVGLLAGFGAWAQTAPGATSPPVATSTPEPAPDSPPPAPATQAQVVIGTPVQQPVAVGHEYSSPPPFVNTGGRPPRWRTRTVPYGGGPIPPDGVLGSRANAPLMAAGGGLLGAGWLGAVIGWIGSVRCSSGFLSISCSSASGWLWIPLIGPWLALTDSSHSAVGNGLIVVDGVVQVAGLAMMIVGAVVRQPVVQFRYLQTRSDRRELPVTLTAWPGGVALAF